MEYLKGLNEAQKEAVLHKKGPLLIVAGAGAGKTKTITHRIAHLIESGVPARQILAVTFTNKAAGEMRERAANLLRGNHGGIPLVCTFHSLGVRILREFSERAGVPRGFSIWDRDDSARAIKKILEKLNLEQWKPTAILSAISREKGDGVPEKDYAERARTFRERAVSQAWNIYESTLSEEGALDFDDLLLRTQNLLSTSEETLKILQNRWPYITIDEYQDTNKSQYEIARLLAGERKNICVVGDTDQCLVAGTKITMSDGERRPIEKIRVGDTVLSNYGSGDYRPAQVTKTFSRGVSSNLIRIATKAGRILTSTPEHIHFAGYKLGLTPQLYFTYLMYKKGKGFRLGVSQVYTRGQRKPMVGFQQRCNHEHADCMWIIATHQTPNEARILEYILSLQYQIPTLPFVARKGLSIGGYVHDQHAIDHIFRSFETEKAGVMLLRKYGLSRTYPHHRAQSKNSNRRNIVVTLCGDRRGKTPMHRISIIGNDINGRRALESLGLPVRPAKKNSTSWRFETARRNYGELRKIVARIQHKFIDANVMETARLGGKKSNMKDGDSLPFLPAGSILPGMAIFDQNGAYDIVKKVERITGKASVYDINVEHTHNFIANGIVTHNSIYSWRGADIEHLLSFEKTFPGTKVVLLEQNYRSTRTILSAANTIIEKNLRRKPKTLFTENPTGEPLSLYSAQNEIDEAWFVATTARQLMEAGTPAGEIAVLYRENFQSRAIEEACLGLSVPYRVLGTRFFERKEVKDVLSYLRLALNPKSRIDLTRIAGIPPRGIGAVTIAKMLENKDDELASGVRAKVSAFRQIILQIGRALGTLPASEAVRFVLETSGMEKMFKQDVENGPERLENVRELVNLATRYDFATPPEGIERLLEEAALMSDQDSLDVESGAISLMTAHASKGLEFDAVFVTGLEQGLFPSVRQSDNDQPAGGKDPEEERRLFYVAVTRARKRIFLSYANERMKYGSREHAIPSEFFEDIDPRLLSYATSETATVEEIIQ